MSVSTDWMWFLQIQGNVAMDILHSISFSFVNNYQKVPLLNTIEFLAYQWTVEKSEDEGYLLQNSNVWNKQDYCFIYIQKIKVINKSRNSDQSTSVTRKRQSKV